MGVGHAWAGVGSQGGCQKCNKNKMNEKFLKLARVRLRASVTWRTLKGFEAPLLKQRNQRCSGHETIETYWTKKLHKNQSTMHMMQC